MEPRRSGAGDSVRGREGGYHKQWGRSGEPDLGRAELSLGTANLSAWLCPGERE